MPIDVGRVVGAELPTTRASWDADRVILYHLGIGAGVPPTDANELEYTYEARLKVLPSFAVIPVFDTLVGMLSVEGLSVNPLSILHGEQELHLESPLPTSAEVVNTARIAAVYDKGKGAVVVVDVETRTDDGSLLGTNRFSAFVRGEGGFGGDSGPPPAHEPPDREPDLTVEAPTLPQQALLYRLSGDKNPLHADPALATLSGHDRPILHGLCSYGIVCKAVVDHVLGGDVTAVRSYAARFSGVVLPGETLVIRMWRHDRAVVVAADTKERATKVVTNAAVGLR